jgi:hypothetical protein
VVNQCLVNIYLYYGILILFIYYLFSDLFRSLLKALPQVLDEEVLEEEQPSRLAPRGCFGQGLVRVEILPDQQRRGRGGGRQRVKCNLVVVMIKSNEIKNCYFSSLNSSTYYSRISKIVSLNRI